MEISFHSHLDSNTVIATKFWTWHDSCAVVACAKICCDLKTSKGITARQSFHRIWIAGKKIVSETGPIMIFCKKTNWLTVTLAQAVGLGGGIGRSSLDSLDDSSLSSKSTTRRTDTWNRHGKNIDGLVQERRNSSALAMELRLSCTNP